MLAERDWGHREQVSCLKNILVRLASRTSRSDWQAKGPEPFGPCLRLLGTAQCDLREPSRVHSRPPTQAPFSPPPLPSRSPMLISLLFLLPLNTFQVLLYLPEFSFPMLPNKLTPLLPPSLLCFLFKL